MTVDRIGKPIRRNRLQVLSGPFRLASFLTAPGDIELTDAFARVSAEWDRQVKTGTVSPIIVQQYKDHIRFFHKFLASLQYTHLDQVEMPLVYRWMVSPKVNGGEPGRSLQRNRLNAISGMFSTAILLGLHDLNPAQAINMPESKKRYVYPLTAAEVQHLKDNAAWRLRADEDGRSTAESKAPAALALLLCGANSAEASKVRVTDLRLSERLVWVHGGGVRSRDRWLPIDDDWCHEALDQRALVVSGARDFDERRPICYDGSGNGTAAVTTMLTKLMRETGVYKEGVNRLESVRDYAAARIFATTGSIEQVAARMGLFSLDIAAHIVGYDWLSATEPADPLTEDGE